MTVLPHPKYRADLDGFRALAVLAVVGFHAFPDQLSGGFVGVDIFFVISGFLISTIILKGLEEGTFSFKEFFARRVRRIFPALIVVLAFCLIFGWYVLLTDEYKQLGEHIAGGVAFISNYLLWRESGYFDNAAETKPLLHLWSLGIEEQFYILWPATLYVIWKKGLNPFLTILSLIAISFALNIAKVRVDVVGTFYSPFSRIWELSAGAMLAYLSLRPSNVLGSTLMHVEVALYKVIHKEKPENGRSALRDVMSMVGALLIAAEIIGLGKGRHFPGWWALFLAIGALLVIAAGPTAWFNRVVLSRPTVVWVGLISYPLYLWHWPLLSFARIVEDETPSLEMRVALIAVSIGLAWLTYKIIERPIRFGGEGTTKTILLSAVLMIVGLVGFSVYQSNGYPHRIPERARMFSAEQYPRSTVYREGTCFLRDDQDYSAFKKCNDQESMGETPVVLWGDSFAAHLYPGLVNVFTEYKIIQRTASGCRPLLGVSFAVNARPYCEDINRQAAHEIASIKPHPQVILAGNWVSSDMPSLERTISFLRGNGVRRITVVGPVPLWRGGLPKIVSRILLSSPDSDLPQRLKMGLIDNVFVLDSEMRDFSHKASIDYVSPTDILCNADGCIVFPTENKTDISSLTSLDHGHLTESGSVLLMTEIRRRRYN